MGVRRVEKELYDLRNGVSVERKVDKQRELTDAENNDNDTVNETGRRAK